MRLVDADKIGFTNFEILMCNGDYKEALAMLIDKIENAPTAYDVDKVVEELEKMTRGVGTTINDNCVIGVRRGYEKASRKAIEIVKAGGKNG